MTAFVCVNIVLFDSVGRADFAFMTAFVATSFIYYLLLFIYETMKDKSAGNKERVILIGIYIQFQLVGLVPPWNPIIILSTEISPSRR